jgi:uncharacterized membrane protein YbhN (UPF0104 family)
LFSRVSGNMETVSTATNRLSTRVGRRGLAAAAGAVVVLAVVVLTPQLLGTRVAQALDALGSANAAWLWLAGVGFGASVLAAAGSWRSAIGLCGGRIGGGEAAACYGAGSLVNTFVPARAGDAVRFALFSRSVERRGRLLRTGGAFAALGAARAVVLAALVVAGAVMGALPLWPVLVLLALVAAAVAVALRMRRHRADGRLGPMLDAFGTLGREPASALRLVGWIALSVGGRLAAAAAVGAALGIGRPLAAAFVIVPALDVAGLVPLTPGNVGVTSGAVAMAFRAHGISFTHGLAAGIAFHAVETAVGIAYGLGSVIWLAPYPSAGTRRLALVAAAAAASLAVAGALSATVVIPLV